MSGTVITMGDARRNPVAAYREGYAAGLRDRGLGPAGGAAPDAVSGATDSPPAPETAFGSPREAVTRETLGVVVPGGAVTSAQMHVMARLVRTLGDGEGDVTASGGLVLRGIAVVDQAEATAALAAAGLVAPTRGLAPSIGAVRPRRGHVGIVRHEPNGRNGRNDVGVAIPVGRLTSHQMDGLAIVGALHGSGALHLTRRRNVVLPEIAGRALGAVAARIRAMGLELRPTSAAAGLHAEATFDGVAAAGLRAIGLVLCRHLDRAIALDMPVTIELSDDSRRRAVRPSTDILVRATAGADGGAAPCYDVALGAGPGAAQTILGAVPAADLPGALARLLHAYVAGRTPAEPFAAFARRHDEGALRAILVGAA